MVSPEVGVPAPRVVLVTGVSHRLGWEVAQRFARCPTVERVVAVDSAAPRGHDATSTRSPLVEFVRADIRNPLIAKVISTAEVDTVVHAALAPARGGAQVAAKEINVLGTMQLLAAAQRAPGVRRMVMVSTTAVYGSGPRHPAVFTEQMEASARAGSGFAREAVEAEGYVRSFARRRPDVAVSVLRLANVVGPDVDSPLAPYLSQLLVPTVFGHDPRFQLLHSADAAAVTVEAGTSAVTGTWNVAGPGVLVLSQALRRAGRASVPLPGRLTGPLRMALGGRRFVDVTSDQLALFSFGRVVDTAAAARDLGFVPRWTSLQAFDDFVTAHGLRGRIDPEWAASLERGARALTAGAR